MVDRIVIKSKHEAWMIFEDRDPIVLYSDKNVLDIINILFTPLEEFQMLEDTQEIKIPMAA